jgi:hypothetical protein
MEGSCEHGNDFSGSIKFEEFLYQPSEYYLLKKILSSIKLFS